MTTSREVSISLYELADDGSKHRLELPASSNLGKGQFQLPQHVPRKGEKISLYSDIPYEKWGEFEVADVHHELTFSPSGLSSHSVIVYLRRLDNRL